MPRKQQDKIVLVMDYFEHAPIDAAKTALAIVDAIIQRRGGKPATTAAVKPSKRKSTGPGPVSEVGG